MMRALPRVTSIMLIMGLNIVLALNTLNSEYPDICRHLFLSKLATCHLFVD